MNLSIFWLVIVTLSPVLNVSSSAAHVITGLGRPIYYDHSDEIFVEQEPRTTSMLESCGPLLLNNVTELQTNGGKFLPLCNVRTGRRIRLRCRYNIRRQQWTWDSLDYNRTVSCWRLQCNEEVFVHDFIRSGNKLEAHQNKWKRAKIGEYASLQDVCMRENGLPVTRRCLRKNNLAAWEDISHWGRIKCLQQTRERTISVQLNTLHDDILQGRRRTNETQGRQQVATFVRGMLRDRNHQLLPADVLVTGEILRSLTEEIVDAAVAQQMVSICSTLMASEQSVLRLSANVNATNTLLSSFETYMDELPEQLVPHTRCGKHITPTAAGDESNEVEHIDFSHMGVQAHITSNLTVFFVNPSCANITGIAVFSEDASGTDLHHATQSGFWYRFIYANESISTIKLAAKVQVATLVPEKVWATIASDLAANNKDAYLVFKVYAHDSLFVETETLLQRKPEGKVLSISIPGYESKLPEAIPFLLRNENATKSGTGNNCGYWNYETWLSDGVQMSSNAAAQHEDVIVCSTQHLTQFAFLVGGSYRQGEIGDNVLITPAHEQVLDVISLVGCSLSLLGLFGIWLTAALFKSWRSLASTKVLLNLCVALTLQMILFVFVNTDDISEQLVAEKDYGRCIALGAFLQYSILVLFCWMLIIALLQFQRYVTVIGIKRPRHYILKSAGIAWGVPLIPTLLVACIDPHSYIPTKYQLKMNTGICYPSGSGLSFGLVLPISLIIAANLIIFIYVFYSISHSLGQTMQRSEKKLVIKQIRLSILLFFLLGLSWIFGIFAFMRAGIAFSYLFCLTSTLQGLVLFIYFVLLDEITQREWSQLLCPKAAKEKAKKKAQELQSMTTSSTNDASRSHV